MSSKVSAENAYELPSIYNKGLDSFEKLTMGALDARETLHELVFLEGLGRRQGLWLLGASVGLFFFVL